MKLEIGQQVVQPGTYLKGEVIQLGQHMVRVEFEDGTNGFYWTETDVRAKERNVLCDLFEQVITTRWKRLPEVYLYAERRGITVAEAIEKLVNEGLSHIAFERGQRLDGAV
jgi:hypothetical protein